MITDLIVKSGGNINVEKTKITSDFDMVVEIKGSTLEIKNKNECTNININGSFMGNSYGSCVNNTYITGGNYNIIGNNISCDKLKGRIIVENIDVTDVVKEYIEKQKDKKQKTECFEYVYPTEISLKSISLTGSCNINIVSPHILKQNISVSLIGSGDIILPKISLTNANVSLTGSGDVDGNGSSVENLVCNLMGSGDIANFKAIDSCNCTVMGSGDIKLQTSNYCITTKNKMGSGSIKIKKD